MASLLKDMSLQEAYRKSHPDRSKSPMLEFIDDPQLWDVDDPRYDWLTDDDRKYLKEAFDFDWYDIMHCADRFMRYEQMLTLLMVSEKEVDKYTMTLWNRPSRQCYDALRMAYRNSAVDGIFKKYADMGNTTAMNILANGVMGLDRDAHDGDIRIKIVNDIGEGGDA